MFDGLWPGFDDREVPITSITNGVHAPTWVDRRVVELAETHLGTRLVDGRQRLRPTSARCPPPRSGACRRDLREQLVLEARRRVRSSWLQARGQQGRAGLDRRHPRPRRPDHRLRPAGADVQAADPDAARPGAAARRCCCDPERPVQIVIAGKSHPADDTGKRLIQQMVQFADDPEVRHRIVFLPNYDIAMAQYLYPGCDVWLNNPLRPFEACGTSGMKSALNGGLNLSILDGWWDEWFDGENGWAIPTADGVEDPEHRDDLEAAALYELIETQVAPRFYDRDEARPAGSLARDGHATPCRTLGPKVLATRMVRDYVEQLYAPATAAGRALNGPASTPAPASWPPGSSEVRAAWPACGWTTSSPPGSATRRRSATCCTCGRFVNLDGLEPSDVEVQVVHGRVSARPTRSARHPGRRAGTTPRPTRAAGTGSRVTCELGRTGSFGYTVRVLPAARRAGQHRRARPGRQRLTPTRDAAIRAISGPGSARDVAQRVGQGSRRRGGSTARRRAGRRTGPAPGRSVRSQVLSQSSSYAVAQGSPGRVTSGRPARRAGPAAACGRRSRRRPGTSAAHGLGSFQSGVHPAAVGGEPDQVERAVLVPRGCRRRTAAGAAPGARGAARAGGVVVASRSSCQAARSQSSQEITLSWQ